jgi:hypothetical protein
MWLLHPGNQPFVARHTDGAGDDVRTTRRPAAPPVHASSKFHYRFAFPQDWRMDDDVRRALKSNLFALRRTNPDGWFVLTAKDYGENPIGDREVVDEAVHRLEDAVDNLEWAKKEDTRLAGRPALRLIFQGEMHAVVVSGECLVLANQGIVYWVMSWAPAKSAVSLVTEMESLRKGFSLVNRVDRPELAARPALVKEFRGERAVYTLRDPHGLWQRWAQPRELDPDADLLLHGREQAAPRDVDRMASVLVCVLAPQDDLAAAAHAAQAHLEKRQKVDYPATVVTVVPAEGGEMVLDQVGAARGRLVRLRVKNGENRQRFLLLAVVPEPKSLLAVECECDWRRRSLWEPDFKQLLSSLTIDAE